MIILRSFIRMTICPEDLSWAKEKSKSFDEKKSHEKFVCPDNYIGVLGELYFSKLLEKEGIDHQWVEFDKDDYTQPDFYVQGKSIDVKTSFDCKMWVQDGKWDYYVFCRVNLELNELFFIRFCKGKFITDGIEKGVLKQIDKGRVNNPYVVSIDQMENIDLLFKNLGVSEDEKKD